MRRSALLTAEDLLRLNIPDKRTELVRGVLVVREPAGYCHGEAAASLLVAIGVHVRTHKLGAVLAAETGFKIFSNPDTVRAPDVAFVSRARVPDPPQQRGYASIAPDLVVEVLSPDDRPGEVREKVADWLAAGVALVWVVDPVKRTARVHRADGSTASIGPDGALDGEHVLPGFVSPLREIL